MLERRNRERGREKRREKEKIIERGEGRDIILTLN
jgi:hypothetical protein